MDCGNMEFELKQKHEEIIEWLTKYKEHTLCKGVVLGLSGGKDSTVVAMLAKKVWGDNVFAIIMPNGAQKDIDDATQIAHEIGIDYRIVNIETIYNSLIHVMESRVDYGFDGEADFVPNCPKITDKAKTNIPPRIRMTILYAVAQTLGYRVIGTGNASETYIGWTTKFGDGACDLNPIHHLTCSEVVALGVELAKEFELNPKYIRKAPSDGLCGKCDEESFGFSYETLDNYLAGKCETDYETALKIEKMHTASEHKRNMPFTID